MPTMGVCDACGMLVRLDPDGRCPRGHPRSRIHDTFETRGSSSASSGLFEPDRSEFATRREPAPPQGTGGMQPPPQQAPASQAASEATPASTARPEESAAQQQARAVKRVGLIVVGIFVAIQLITMCGGFIGALFSGN